MNINESSHGQAVADWRVPADYPDLACREMNRWAWECLRRNIAYQRDAALMLQLPISWQLRLGDPKYANTSRSGKSLRALQKAEETALMLAGLPTEATDDIPRGIVNLSPLRVFRQKWCVNFAFAHTLPFKRVSVKRELDPQEIKDIARSASLKKRKNLPALRVYSVAPTSFTHTAVRKPKAAIKRAGKSAPAILPLEKRKISLAPNEGLFKFFLNGSLAAQIRSAEQWLDAEKKSYSEAETLNGFRLLPSGGALSALGGVGHHVQPNNLHWALRIYDAMVAAGRHTDDALHGDVKRAVIELFSEEQAAASLAVSQNADFRRSSATWLKQAKWYVDQGGYVAVAQYVKVERKKRG